MSSFEASSLIQHNVTKGESRELQILDILANSLPTSVLVQRNVVIIDSDDTESPKFDGVLYNRTSWPLLFQDDTVLVAMIESVAVAIEVKSQIDTAELLDIFTKAHRLRSMRSGQSGSLFAPPLVTAFAYQCHNIGMAFFDFSLGISQNSLTSPSLLCVLNRAIFGLAVDDSGILVPQPVPKSEAIPILFETDDDSLLIFIYFLTQWISEENAIGEAFARYSERMFANLTVFHFEGDFLHVITADRDKAAQARTFFSGYPHRPVSASYTLAREALGLPASIAGGMA